MDIHYGRKRSGILKQLKSVIRDWLNSIEDDVVRKAASDDVIITGGSIASMLLGEKINDYDIYFRTKDTTELVAEYYVNQFNREYLCNDIEDGPEADEYTPFVKVDQVTNIKGEVEERVMIYIKSDGVAGDIETEYEYSDDGQDDVVRDDNDDTRKKYRPIFLSQNAITLSDKMQIVIRFYGEPTKIHDNYDFVHAMCYFDYGQNILHFPSEALECLLSRTLIYQGSLYPIASIFRMKKFIERGWRISAGQQLKIMWQISELDLSDRDVLKEQLTGVDQAYMHQLINALSGVDSDKIDSSYVGTIIDKIFD